jgi:hypothetical protein
LSSVNLVFMMRLLIMIVLWALNSIFIGGKLNKANKEEVRWGLKTVDEDIVVYFRYLISCLRVLADFRIEQRIFMIS